MVSPVLAQRENRCPLVNAFASFDEALSEAMAREGAGAMMAVIPQGPYVLPCVSGGTGDKGPQGN